MKKVFGRELRPTVLRWGVRTSVVLVPVTILLSVAAIWSDSDHMNETANLFWGLLALTWCVVGVFFLFTVENF